MKIVFKKCEEIRIYESEIYCEYVCFLRILFGGFPWSVRCFWKGLKLTFDRYSPSPRGYNFWHDSLFGKFSKFLEKFVVSVPTFQSNKGRH
jgi:hypothetical protein